jgi:hypothetical protein
VLQYRTYNTLLVPWRGNEPSALKSRRNLKSKTKYLTLKTRCFKIVLNHNIYKRKEIIK